MKFNIVRTILIPVAIAGALISCKKKEEHKTLPSLDGKISFYAPEFIRCKGSITMTPSGVKHPETGQDGYGIYWKVTPVMKKGDTTRFENGLDKNGHKSDGAFKYTFPDSLGTFGINCYAYASGYAGVSAIKNVTTVDNRLEGSVTGRGIHKGDPVFKSSEGEEYYFTTKAGKDWFRNNLYSKGGIPFRKSLLMADIFGRFYSYEEALNACPEGWRLPTEEDWISLAKELGASEDTEKFSNIPGIAKKLMGDAKFNTLTMWEYWREVGEITNESSMAMIPVGYVNLGTKDSKAKEDEWLDLSYPDAKFKGVYDYAAFWTADTEGDQAYYRYLHVKSPDFKIGKADKRYFGASVRCVRDSRQ